MNAPAADFYHLYIPRDFDAKIRAVPAGYRLVRDWETLIVGDIYWNSARGEWNYTAAAGTIAAAGTFYRKL